MTRTLSNPSESLRKRTAAWVVGICFMGLVFDGYDLVVYGTVLSTLLRDPEWALTPAQAGAIGSYALFGMMVGALAAGAVGDYIGRRRLLLGSIAWFSIGMGLTAMAPDVTLFGAGRFFTGIGIGALVAAAGATVAEFAPPGKRNLYNAIVFAGYPVGGVLASVVALAILEPFGFRTLFWIGALPLVTLLPLAIVKLPESPTWLHSRGRLEEARAVSERTGVPLPDGEIAPVADTKRARGGLVGLFTGKFALATILIGFMSAGGLMLTYALNTWLPELMGRAGFSVKGSLSFLLVLNGGAIFGSLFASRFADRFGAEARHRRHVHPRGTVDRRSDPHAAVARAARVRRDRGPGHDRHPGADLRLRVQLLPDLHAGRRRGVGSRLRPPGGYRGSAHRRASARRGPRPEMDLPDLRADRRRRRRRHRPGALGHGGPPGHRDRAGRGRRRGEGIGPVSAATEVSKKMSRQHAKKGVVQ